jgi:hypothetical protein
MTDAFTEARKRGDTHGQRDAHERAKRAVNASLLKTVKRGRRAKIKRALGLA